jgi:hypothetical protein
MLVLLMGGIMNYAVEIGSCAVMYHDIRTKFYKYWFRHLKVYGGVHEETVIGSHKPNFIVPK